jgi:hypothetical protein
VKARGPWSGWFSNRREPREVHHFSLLIGYGCGAINPYLAYETLDDMIRQGMLKDIDHKTAMQELHQGRSPRGGEGHLEDGHLDDSKSYRGAQIFEAIGLQQRFHRQVLHLDPHGWAALGIDVRSRRKCCAGIDGRFRIGLRTATPWTWAASISGVRMASCICSIP